MLDKGTIARMNKKEMAQFIISLKPTTFSSSQLELFEISLFNLFSTGFAYSKIIEQDNDDEIRQSIRTSKILALLKQLLLPEQANHSKVFLF